MSLEGFDGLEIHEVGPIDRVQRDVIPALAMETLSASPPCGLGRTHQVRDLDRAVRRSARWTDRALVGSGGYEEGAGDSCRAARAHAGRPHDDSENPVFWYPAEPLQLGRWPVGGRGCDLGAGVPRIEATRHVGQASEASRRRSRT